MSYCYELAGPHTRNCSKNDGEIESNSSFDHRGHEGARRTAELFDKS